MADFYVALAKVLRKEGGYGNNPSDKGGETYKGISRKYHPLSIMWKYIDRYKEECGGINAKFKRKLDADKSIAAAVASIYKKQYWNPFKLDTVPNQKVAEQIFDDAVNRGVAKACRLCCSLFGLPIVNKPSERLILQLQLL